MLSYQDDLLGSLVVVQDPTVVVYPSSRTDGLPFSIALNGRDPNIDKKIIELPSVDSNHDPSRSQRFCEDGRDWLLCQPQAAFVSSLPDAPDSHHNQLDHPGFCCGCPAQSRSYVSSVSSPEVEPDDKLPTLLLKEELQLFVCPSGGDGAHFTNGGLLIAHRSMEARSCFTIPLNIGQREHHVYFSTSNSCASGLCVVPFPFVCID